MEVPAGQLGFQLDQRWLVVMPGPGGLELQEGGHVGRTGDAFAADLVVFSSSA